MSNIESRSSFPGFKPYQIRAFLAVAEHLSIRAAAKALFISQPAVTRTVRELELELAAPLLVRGTKGVQLTACGQAFLQRARLLIEESRRTREEIEQIQSGVTGTVRVGVATVPAMLLIPNVYQTFRQRMPGAELECLDGQFPVASSALLSGQVDLVLTQMPNERLPDALQFELLFTSPLAVVGRVGHPRIKSRTLNALKDDEWIAWDRKMVEDIFHNGTTPIPARIMRCQSVETARALVERTDMLSFFSEPLLKHELVKHGIQQIKVREQLASLSVGIITRKEARLTPAAALFCELVRQAAKVFQTPV